MAADHPAVDDVPQLNLKAGRLLFIDVGQLGILTKRSVASAPIFFQHTHVRGIESRVHGLPNEIEPRGVDFAIAVRAETRESRPRLRSAYLEPFVDATKPMFRSADGSVSFRIRFPNGGECKPMVANEAR